MLLDALIRQRAQGQRSLEAISPDRDLMIFFFLLADLLFVSSPREQREREAVHGPPGHHDPKGPLTDL